MARKKVADMTPDELDAYREYMREAKRKSRAGGVEEKRKPDKRNRTEYRREQRQKAKEAADIV